MVGNKREMGSKKKDDWEAFQIGLGKVFQDRWISEKSQTSPISNYVDSIYNLKHIYLTYERMTVRHWALKK